MADTPQSDSLVRQEAETPEQDPIASRSTSGIMLISALLLTAVLAWSLYDEAYGQRPWKAMQREFVARYTAYLKSIRGNAKTTEAEVKESAEYQQLDADYNTAFNAVDPEVKDLQRQVRLIQAQLDAVTEPFQQKRGEFSVDNYRIETVSSNPNDPKKTKMRQALEQEKQKPIEIKMPPENGAGSPRTVQMTFPELDQKYTDLKDKKAQILSQIADKSREPTELRKKRDEYLKNHMVGLSEDAINKLIERNAKFDYSIAGHQINVPQYNIVDRCEVCHLGVREPLTLTPANLSPGGPGKKPDADARAFVSHPNKELLDIHNPDRFGCASCHWGNGRATTTVEKGHGRHKFWLHPLFSKENMQAGCQQCHAADRVIQGADTLNLGKDMFQQRGCVGCHRSEGFDREADALSNTRQTISQLGEQMAANERLSKQRSDESANATDDVTAQQLLREAESLRVTNSQLAARVDQLNIQARYLMQDQKKVGPNLKDVRLKLRKEWMPIWLKDPQAFRPGTKMPTFWRFSTDSNGDEQVRAISAFLWQEGFDGKVPEQQRGDGAHGKELFETRGCMACHSIGDPDDPVAATFAANLSKVGQKAGFDYIVRWIHNPRERWAPYCPKEKRDLTRADYEAKGLPYVFDTEQHSRCPNDGAELQVQNMTVMPNFRLTDSDARDIATYIFSLSEQQSYPDASFMDDPNLKETGRSLIKQYGCAGCHEIKGFEEEQRIGKELTNEGATPLERLDFALLTQPAERGIDPFTGKTIKNQQTGEVEEWYNHKGFFEHKLADPAVYDKGKEKDAKDRLRMPKPSLRPEWREAITTFLLGSVGTEGANVPQSLFYLPQDQRRQDVQNGWWVIKKYNCMGCHSVQVGQNSVLMGLPQYLTPEGKDQLPPRLTSEGARVDPNWLLRFLHDPSLADTSGAKATQEAPAAAKPPPAASAASKPSPTAAASNGGATTAVSNKLPAQPGLDRNGVRPYLKVRMPTFNFSPNELRILVRFFMAVSAQQDPYIKEPLTPLSEEERLLARALFQSKEAPCLKCHVNGDPVHDKNASAPNFLLASERLKPEWTMRWLLDPAQISPGTAMPSGLFVRDNERWVFNGQTPAGFANYHRDHADLLVRYMFQMTQDEQRRLVSGAPAATAAAPVSSASISTSGANPSLSHSQKTGRRIGRADANTLQSPASMNSTSMRDGSFLLSDRFAVTHRFEWFSPRP